MRQNSDPLRYFRYCIFVVESIFERIRGLDFTTRDLTLPNQTNGKFHGYSKTNEKHIRKLFDSLDWSYSRNFIDVGCGKGVVLREACRYPFKMVEGIEYSQEIASIAKKNFTKMGGGTIANIKK